MPPAVPLDRVIVVFVHGLWMTGIDMSLLRRRVRRDGFKVRQFSYSSIGGSVRENAAQLQHFIARLDADSVHLVGHSLGGLLIRQLIAARKDTAVGPRIGRIVTLGTPHQGSVVACKMASTPLRHLLGRSVDEGLDGRLPPWIGQHKLGVIAGTLNIGVGWLLPSFSGVASDGTVKLDETRLEGMTDHISVTVSHTALLFSRVVARQVCAFLQQGHFESL